MMIFVLNTSFDENEEDKNKKERKNIERRQT